MSLRNAVPQNILLDRIEQEFSPEIATQISQYFGFHQFDEWFDIFDDINQSYEDCCCKTTLFEQLHVSDNDQKQKQYLRLKQCLHPCTTNEQTTQNIIGNGIKYICNGQTEQFIKDYRSGQVHEIVCQIRTHLGETFAQLFERYVEEQEYVLDSIQEDMETINDSTILEYIMGNATPTVVQMKSSLILIQTKIKNIVMGGPFEEKGQATAPAIEKIITEIRKMYDPAFAQHIVDKFTEVVNEECYDLESLVEDKLKEIHYKDARHYHQVVREIRDVILRIEESPTHSDLIRSDFQYQGIRFFCNA
eukprot:883612_1